MKASHARPLRRAVFDEPKIRWPQPGLFWWSRWPTGWVLEELADQFLTIPTDKGANGRSNDSRRCGDGSPRGSIDDMAIQRHAGMAPESSMLVTHHRLSGRSYARSGSRSCPATGRGRGPNPDRAGSAEPPPPGIDDYALADMDDSIIEVDGYAKQGAGFGYTQVRGLNSFIGTVSTPRAARSSSRNASGKGPARRGAGRRVADTLATVKRLRPAGATGPVLLRADWRLRPQGPGRGPPREGGRVDHGAADQEDQGRDRRDPR